MTWLDDPIDLAEYIRIYKEQRRVGEDYILIRFSQSAQKYSATWQNPDFINTLHGNPTNLKKWLAEHNGVPA